MERYEDIAALSDDQLARQLTALEARRPGAVVSSGVRPRRRPWTYRDIWRLEQLHAERARRGGLAGLPESARGSPR